MAFDGKQLSSGNAPRSVKTHVVIVGGGGEGWVEQPLPISSGWHSFPAMIEGSGENSKIVPTNKSIK